MGETLFCGVCVIYSMNTIDTGTYGDPSAIRTALLVVHDELLRVGLRESIQVSPFMQLVGEVAETDAALEAVARLQPNLVIIHNRPPSIEQVKLTRKIKSISRQTYVLIMADTEADAIDCLIAGAEGFIMMNSELDRLVQAVQCVAEGAGWIDPAIAPMLFRSLENPSRHSPPIVFNDQPQITQREREVLAFLVQGLSNMEIANRMHISVETVKSHIKHLMEKLGMRGRTSLAIWALDRAAQEKENKERPEKRN